MKRSTLSLLVVVALARPESAFAQGAPTPPAHEGASLSESLSGAAKTAFTSAQTLINNGDFAGAYLKLGQAYDLSKDPRLLFNMAICARDMHDYAKMQTLLLRYKREGKATIAADELAQVDAALKAMRDLVGGVRLKANVEGATVAVDGETVGTTPLAERIPLNLGKHRITVSKEGFQTTEEIVTVAGGSETPLAVMLLVQPETQPAHLIVASDEGATIVIDGSQGARGRFDGALAPGAHEVSVTEPGKLSYKSQVELHEGETRSVDVTLSDEKHAVWPWIVGSVAVAAGAAVGGYFLFKSPDQQPAGLNPSFATVKFTAFGWR
jgi:hypothetical protein